ncbi:hypothetical protein AMR41_20045 [Hapalosiphon sp. MRB220]|nr:hypothetical protein AMR41_20045 [Hapalosiphon sp. MRB220]
MEIYWHQPMWSFSRFSEGDRSCISQATQTDILKMAIASLLVKYATANLNKSRRISDQTNEQMAKTSQDNW